MVAGSAHAPIQSTPRSPAATYLFPKLAFVFSAFIAFGACTAPEQPADVIINIEGQPLVELDFSQLERRDEVGDPERPGETEQTRAVLRATAAIPSFTRIEVYTLYPVDMPADVDEAFANVFSDALQDSLPRLQLQQLNGLPAIGFSCQLVERGAETAGDEDVFIMGALIGTSEGVVLVNTGNVRTLVGGTELGEAPPALLSFLQSVDAISDPADSDVSTWLDLSSHDANLGNVFICTDLVIEPGAGSS